MEKTQTELTDELKSAAATQLMLIQNISSAVARAEALSIVVNVLNAYMDIKNKEGAPLTKAEAEALQAAVNSENASTEAIFSKLQEELGIKTEEEDKKDQQPIKDSKEKA